MDKEFSDIVYRFSRPYDVLNPTVTIRRANMNRTALGCMIPSGQHDGDAMWLEAHPGGLRLGQHILNNRSEFAGKKVVDAGAGSGLLAIAAAKAGAAEVRAIESNPLGVRVIRLNAEENGVANIEAVQGDVFDPSLYEGADIITAGDLFYHAPTLKALTRFFAA